MHTSNNKVELFSLLNIPFNHSNNLKKVFKWFRDDSNRRYKIIFDKECNDNYFDLQQLHSFYPDIRTLAVVVNPWNRMFNAFLYFRKTYNLTTTFEKFIMYKLNL
jgi:hypothetical protein